MRNLVLAICVVVSSYTVLAGNMVAQHYTENYSKARAQFLKVCKSLEDSHKVTGEKFRVPSKQDQDLYVDTCFLRASQPKSKLNNKIVIVTAGVHGVEGAIGSAVTDLMMKNLPENGLDFLFIHSLNPFGQKYLRRVTENNVDFSRNWSVDSRLYRTKNEGYKSFKDYLNPKDKLSGSFFELAGSYLKMAYYIAQYGIPDLRQAILKGQYSFPKGLYYGGSSPEPQANFIKDQFETAMSGKEQILHLDIHSGYGNRGEVHFFPNPIPNHLLPLYKAMFLGYKLDIPDESEDFYEVSGDLSSFLMARYPEKSVVSLALEYGTNNNIDTLGSIRSLQIMRRENQAYHHGVSNDSVSKRVAHEFVEMYNPSDEQYRRDILEQTAALWPKILENFSKIDADIAMKRVTK